MKWLKKQIPLSQDYFKKGCIEPWFGHTDYVNASPLLKQKRDMLSLEGNQSFQCSYAMDFK